jgi:hypothetical protein
MSDYKNYNQIYTHSTEYGVIIGQYWNPKNNAAGLSGRVRCILEDGYVIIDHLPKLCASTRIDIDTITKDWVIKLPVLILPYIRVNKSLGIQVFAFKDEYTTKPYVFGELRTGYEPW